MFITTAIQKVIDILSVNLKVNGDNISAVMLPILPEIPLAL
jgi:hypothetical protein